MEFRTKIGQPEYQFTLTPHDKFIFVGSCFAVNIGQQMQSRKFDCLVNPFGVLYNPASICRCFQELRQETPANKQIFTSGDTWQSWLYDSSFQADTRENCLNQIQRNNRLIYEYLQKTSYLFITLGTNHVYRLKESGDIVGNCHKQPSRLFTEESLGVSDCIQELKKTLSICRRINPNLQVIFTVSPYRYAKYGFHESQLSKATLLLAIDSLCREEDGCHYFPAYEILLDELRDYRFYKEDMLHPSEQAIHYIWECFAQALFSEETCKFVKAIEEIMKGMEHRPRNPEAPAYKDFLSKILLKIEGIQKKYPNLAWDNELNRLYYHLK